jgi:hypothetical protein
MPVGRFEKILYAAIAILAVIMFASLTLVANTANTVIHDFFFDYFVALLAMAFFLASFKIAQALAGQAKEEAPIITDTEDE